MNISVGRVLLFHELQGLRKFMVTVVLWVVDPCQNSNPVSPEQHQLHHLVLFRL